MRVSKLFCEPKLWTAFEKAAAKEALQWVASRHVQALDSFAWTREKARSGDSEQFFGLVRVAKENVGPLLSSSGQQGVFVSAPRNVPEAAAAACEVVWVDRAPQEKAVTYLERVTRMASSHGLALSNMRLGWRRPLAKDEVPARIWLVTDVPKSWDHRAVADLLDTAFADPVILSHRWAKKSLTYRFKAKVKSGGDKDIVPLVCEHLGANITLWASIAPPRKQQTLSKPVYTRSVPVIKAAATPNVATEAVAVRLQTLRTRPARTSPSRSRLSRRCESSLLTLSMLSALGMVIACYMPSQKHFCIFVRRNDTPEFSGLNLSPTSLSMSDIVVSGIA